MKYLLLLRGINVGGKNKVVMSELRAQIEALGYEAVTTYINSGNAFFETEEPLERIKAKIGDMLATYPFTIYHVILSRDAYLADTAQVPDWWQEPLARRDVLFYTDQVDYEHMKARIQAMPLHDEVVHFGDRGIGVDPGTGELVDLQALDDLPLPALGDAGEGGDDKIGRAHV